MLLILFEQNQRLEKEIHEIREQLNQDSHNSSKPPSGDGCKKPSPKSLGKKSGKKPGGQAGHTGHGLKLSGEITERIQLEVETCPCCGSSLEGARGKKIETRYMHEIPKITVETAAFKNHEKVCPTCGTVCRGKFPEVAGSTQEYGPNLKGYTVLLAGYGMAGIRRIQALLGSICGLRISEGTIAGTVVECGKRLRGPAEGIRRGVLQAKGVHFDGTGMGNQGVLWRLHTASAKMLAYMRIHRKRGNEGMEGGGILPVFEGTGVHDCWKACWVCPCEHALRNARVLRELTGVAERTGQGWAEGMAGLLWEMKGAAGRYQEKHKERLPAYLDRKFSERYDELAREGMGENPLAEQEAGKGETEQGEAVIGTA